MRRKIAAILAADVAGYSRLISQDEEETLSRLHSYRQVFADFVGRAGGRIFNTAGDSVMCEFGSAVEAMRAAIDIQESLRTRNLAYPTARRLEFRIGITIGDVVERDGDLLGDGVNIAARLESLAAPGGICVSRSVHEAVASKVSVAFRDMGPREVKNLPAPVHAYMVAWPGSEVTTGARRRLVAWIGAVAAVLMLVAGAAALWWRPASVQPAAIPGPALQPAPTASAPASPPRSAPVRAPQRAEAPKPAPQAVPPAAPAPVAAPPTAAPAPAAAPEPSRQAEAPASAPALPADPAEAFAALEKQGGIIADAKSAPELYHNARVLEERGDADAARRAYAAVAALGLDFIDPHLRYAALLGTRDGRAGARAAYAEIVREHPARPAALVHALQFDGAERRAKVDAVAAENPDYGPAQYLVADEHSQDRLGAQTLTERRLEFEALDAFLEADAEGRLKPFFLDGSVLAQWLTRARDRKAAVEAFFQATPTQPTATFARSGSGWTGTLTIPEPATTIAVRVGDSGEFKPTGFLPGKDARTGKPAPRPSFALPAAQERATVYVTYDDTTGHTAGPFPIAFDPQAALVAAEREVLERSSASWILFRADMANVIDFGRLIRNRCAIAKVELGYDDGPLEIELPLPSCDEKHPDAMPADAKPNLSVPKGTRSVAVQLTYADGAQSEVKTFRR